MYIYIYMGVCTLASQFDRALVLPCAGLCGRGGFTPCAGRRLPSLCRRGGFRPCAQGLVHLGLCGCPGSYVLRLFLAEPNRTL